MLIVLIESIICLSLLTNKIRPFFFKSSELFNKKKCISSGFPIRKLMVKRMERKPIDILILGGSQGSKLLNKKFKDSLKPLLNKIKDSFDQKSEFTIVHQCGLNNDVQLEDFYNQIRKEFPFFKFELHQFINNIDEYYLIKSLITSFEFFISKFLSFFSRICSGSLLHTS